MNAQEFFNDTIKNHMKYLKSLRDNSPNQLVCILITYESDKGLHIYSIQTDDQSPINAIKPIVYRVQPEFYIVFSEGWSISNRDLEKPHSDLKHGDIEKMKKRKEVLNCYGQSKDGKYKVSKMFEIKRKNNQDIIDLIEYEGKIVSDKLP